MAHKDKKVSEIHCAILTVSSSRKNEQDESGSEIKRLLEKEGFEIVDRRIVVDDLSKISSSIQQLLATATQVIIITGGTGISTKDCTVKALKENVDVCLPGFGELFRGLSHKQIGERAILSRAVAGLVNQKLIFALPGSPDAVKLAIEQIIIPVLPHAVYELTKE